MVCIGNPFFIYVIVGLHICYYMVYVVVGLPWYQARSSCGAIPSSALACRRVSSPSADEVMTGLNHNLITQRFKLNNKVALITGTAALNWPALPEVLSPRQCSSLCRQSVIQLLKAEVSTNAFNSWTTSEQAAMAVLCIVTAC